MRGFRAQFLVKHPLKGPDQGQSQSCVAKRVCTCGTASFVDTCNETDLAKNSGIRSTIGESTRPPAFKRPVRAPTARNHTRPDATGVDAPSTGLLVHLGIEVNADYTLRTKGEAAEVAVKHLASHRYRAAARASVNERNDAAAPVKTPTW
ncbi:hypothetical protein MRX96_040508 [Rhipicephalus microplus]